MSGDDAAAMLQRFRRYLRDRGLPVTRQRDMIAETLFHATDHPSADTIERQLRVREISVGTATVYRTLELLTAAGLADSHDFGDGARRYEPRRGGGEHGHLVCRRCGRVSEFTNERLERMLPVLADEHGFQQEHHRVEIHGTCRECRRRP